MVECLFCIQEVEGSIPSKSKEKIAWRFWCGTGRGPGDSCLLAGRNPHRSKNKIRGLTSNFLNLVFTNH